MAKQDELTKDISSFIVGMHSVKDKKSPEKPVEKPLKPKVNKEKAIPKKVKKGGRIVEISEESKRGTSGFFIFPEYETVINQIMLHKNHRKIGGTLEFLIEHYLNSLSENELKAVLKIKSGGDY